MDGADNNDFGDGKARLESDTCKHGVATHIENTETHMIFHGKIEFSGCNHINFCRSSSRLGLNGRSPCVHSLFLVLKLRPSHEPEGTAPDLGPCLLQPQTRACTMHSRPQILPLVAVEVSQQALHSYPADRYEGVCLATLVDPAMGLLTVAVKRCGSKTLLRGACASCCSSSPCGVRGKEQSYTPDKRKRWRRNRFWRKKKKSSRRYSGDCTCVSISELARRGESEAIADLVNNISAKSGN